MLLSSIPFWFLPKSLPKQGEEESENKSTELATVAEQENFLPEEGQDQEEKEGEVTFKQLAKGITQLLGHYFIQHPYNMPDFMPDFYQKKHWFKRLHLPTPKTELTCLIIDQVEPKKNAAQTSNPDSWTNQHAVWAKVEWHIITDKHVVRVT